MSKQRSEEQKKEYLQKVNEMLNWIEQNYKGGLLRLDTGSVITNMDHFLRSHRDYLNNTEPLTRNWNIYASRVNKVMQVISKQ